MNKDDLMQEIDDCLFEKEKRTEYFSYLEEKKGVEALLYKILRYLHEAEI